MRCNKWLFITTGIISILSLSFAHRFQQCTFAYDIALACFGSAVLACFISFITYNSEKRDAMENFWQVSLSIIKKVETVKRISCDAPIELVKNAIYEEWKNESLKCVNSRINMGEQDSNKKALLLWLKEHQVDQKQMDTCSSVEIEKYVDALYKRTLNDVEKSAQEAMESYILLAETALNDLGNAYGRLDFLHNRRIRKQIAYNGLYLPIKEFRNKCAEEARHFRYYFNNEGNIGVCIDKVMEIERQIFTVREGCIYNNLADLLNFNLERFRTKVYHCPPELEGPIPIGAFSNYLQETDSENNANNNRIPILNTYIDNLTAKEAKERVDHLIRKEGYHYVVTPNSDNIVKMQSDYELKTISENADLILTDGQVVVNISRRTKHPIKERVAMTDFVWDVIELAVEKDYGIFLLGGKEEVLNEAALKIKLKYPSLRIIDTYSPPLGFEKDSQKLSYTNDRIKNSKADILIVFLGCPKQEKYIANNKDKYQIPISFTMGGCVDFIAGSVKRAPIWMQNIGLEWLYRFAQEPRRLFKRYFVDDVEIFDLANLCRKAEKGDKS